MLLALIEGGALLDFRDLSGSTPLHRAVESNNIEAVITLLELGSSPNCKDTRGLTPLYLSISRKTDVSICEMLLHNKATIGAQDVQGWQEIHQVSLQIRFSANSNITRTLQMKYSKSTEQIKKTLIVVNIKLGLFACPQFMTEN